MTEAEGSIDLYHAHSHILNGFYKSGVYVVASSPEMAVLLAVEAFDRWIKECIDRWVLPPGMEHDPQDEPDEFKAELAERRKAFSLEMQEKLMPTEFGALIEYSL